MLFRSGLNLTGCVLSWSPSCPVGFTVTLQLNAGAGFANVSGATSPYSVPAGGNGTYRLNYLKAGCTGFTTNSVVVSCAPISCTCSGTLTNTNCSLSWTACSGFTSQLQTFVGGVWTNVTGSSPQTTNNDAQFRVVYTKAGCSDFTSNVITTACNCANCTAAAPTIQSNCNVVWSTCTGWSSTLQAYNGSTWVDLAGATSPYTIAFSYLKYRVKYIKIGPNACTTIYTSGEAGNYTVTVTSNTLTNLVNAGGIDFIMIYKATASYCALPHTDIFSNIPNDHVNNYTIYQIVTPGCTGVGTKNFSNLKTVIDNWFTANSSTNVITNTVVQNMTFSMAATDPWLQYTELKLYYVSNDNTQSCLGGTQGVITLTLNQCYYCE